MTPSRQRSVEEIAEGVAIEIEQRYPGITRHEVQELIGCAIIAALTATKEEG